MQLSQQSMRKMMRLSQRPLKKHLGGLMGTFWKTRPGKPRNCKFNMCTLLLKSIIRIRCSKTSIGTKRNTLLKLIVICHQGVLPQSMFSFLNDRNLCAVSKSQELALKLKGEERGRSKGGRSAHDRPEPSTLPAPATAQVLSTKGLAGSEANKTSTEPGGGHTALIECCCGPPDSLLGRSAKEKGMKCLRITKGSHDLTTAKGLEQAKRETLKMVTQGHKTALWASLPCKPWSKRNVHNAWRHGPRFKQYLEDIRQEPMIILDSFFELAEIVLKAKGSVSFEWPDGCVGWRLCHLQSFFCQTRDQPC